MESLHAKRSRPTCLRRRVQGGLLRARSGEGKAAHAPNARARPIPHVKCLEPVLTQTWGRPDLSWCRLVPCVDVLRRTGNRRHRAVRAPASLNLYMLPVVVYRRRQYVRHGEPAALERCQSVRCQSVKSQSVRCQSQLPARDAILSETHVGHAQRAVTMNYYYKVAMGPMALANLLQDMSQCLHDGHVGFLPRRPARLRLRR